MQAIHLQTEYLSTPLGLGIGNPRFYWNCKDGKRQTAYRVVVKTGEEVIWDTGKVASSSMTHICYQGRPLKSREHIEWSVRLWDENDVPGKEQGSWFEMGLLCKSDWKAKWIAGNYRPKKNVRWPVDCFRKKFSAGKEIKCARLYITACGIYEARLNGQRVGDFVLAPGCTDYRKRLQYQVYDVTELLGRSNELTVQVADGWYRGSIGCFGPTNVFGRMTGLLCQLEIRYADGTEERIISDDTWEWSNDGPVRFADLKDGEIVDADMHPGYGSTARLLKETMLPEASDNVYPKEQEAFKAQLITTPSGKKVLDFGQNIAGVIAFTVKGDRGQTMKLACGEMLDENGEFTQKNMQEYKPVKEFGRMTEMLLITGNREKLKGEMQPTPKQEILFSCSGRVDDYKSRFTVFGFRYALIETEIDFKAEDFRAVAVYSDLEQTGEFSCSHEGINRLVENTRWSMKGNYLDVPTDCPTRERLGWTGDAQVFFDTGAYLMNVAPFFRKWLRDVRDNQSKNGKISAVVPYNGASMLYDNTGASVGWGDCAVLLPYRYWKRYGDIGIIRDFYDVMRGYAMFMIKNTGHKDEKAAKANPFNQYTYEKGIHLGEWLEPEEFKDHISAGTNALHTEECTAYLHYTMRHMVETAHALEKREDEQLFSEYAEGARNAYRWLFLKDGIPQTDRQAKLVRPLAFGLSNDVEKEALELQLAKAVENRRYRIGTGFLSTPFILGTLSGMGRSDLAYKMLENEEAPGWLYEVKNGATTIWEDWEGTVSHNHYSPGSVCQWLFDTVAGIRVAGENHFVIAPVPGGTLSYAEAGYRSLYGKVFSRWELVDGHLQFVVEIPANTTAEVILPDGVKHVVESGRHIIKSMTTSHPEKLPGNAGEYSVVNTPANPDSPLNGKRVIFLGSSVVYGSDAMEESFVDFMEKIDGIISVKEAVSGTTLVDKTSYGKESYITRMKTIDPGMEADAFVCQLSTNDATMKLPLGDISESCNKEEFDTQTVTGAMEYVIAYAQETWKCPVIFFTGTRYTSRGSEEYAAMVERLLQLQEKWDIGVIDLWNDAEMQAVSEEAYALYMSNGIHPTRAGYRDWWTPKFESYLTEYLGLD